MPDLKEAYATLCEYSHPASPTVFRYAIKDTEQSLLRFDPRADAEPVRQLWELAGRIGPTLLELSISSGVVTLKTLNAFDLEAVKTPWAAATRLSSSGVWGIIQAKLAVEAKPQVASPEEEARLKRELLRYYEPLRKRPTR